MTNPDYSSSCRFCLWPVWNASGSRPLYPTQAEKFNSMFRLQITQDERLPKLVCVNCCYKLTLVEDFYGQIVRSNTRMGCLFYGEQDVPEEIRVGQVKGENDLLVEEINHPGEDGRNASDRLQHRTDGLPVTTSGNKSVYRRLPPTLPDHGRVNASSSVCRNSTVRHISPNCAKLPTPANNRSSTAEKSVSCNGTIRVRTPTQRPATMTPRITQFPTSLVNSTGEDVSQTEDGDNSACVATVGSNAAPRIVSCTSTVIAPTPNPASITVPLPSAVSAATSKSSAAERTVSRTNVVHTPISSLATMTSPPSSLFYAAAVGSSAAAKTLSHTNRVHNLSSSPATKTPRIAPSHTLVNGNGEDINQTQEDSGSSVSAAAVESSAAARIVSCTNIIPTLISSPATATPRIAQPPAFLVNGNGEDTNQMEEDNESYGCAASIESNDSARTTSHPNTEHTPSSIPATTTVHPPSPDRAPTPVSPPPPPVPAQTITPSASLENGNGEDINIYPSAEDPVGASSARVGSPRASRNSESDAVSESSTVWRRRSRSHSKGRSSARFSFNCLKCPGRYKTKEQFELHFCSGPPPTDFACRYCSRVFKDRERLVCHKQEHKTSSLKKRKRSTKMSNPVNESRDSKLETSGVVLSGSELGSTADDGAGDYHSSNEHTYGTDDPEPKSRRCRRPHALSDSEWILE